MAAFKRLIRFEDAEGKTVYGDLEKEVPTREIEGSTVEVLEGDVKSGFNKAGSKAKVAKVCQWNGNAWGEEQTTNGAV